MSVKRHDSSCVCPECEESLKRFKQTEARWLTRLGWLPIALFAWFLWSQAESNGWVSHEVETTITADAGWIVGESRDCTSVTGPGGDAFGRTEGLNPFGRIDCGKSADHRMKITFHRREKQPEYAVITWKCTRTADSFTCSELSRQKAPHPPERSQAASPSTSSLPETCHDPNEVLGQSGLCWCKQGFKRDSTTLKCLPE